MEVKCKKGVAVVRGEEWDKRQLVVLYFVLWSA